MLQILDQSLMTENNLEDTRTWAYHHSCEGGQIFPHPDAIPEGWVDSPAKVEAPKKRGRPPNVKKDLDVQEGNEEAGDLQADPSKES